MGRSGVKRFLSFECGTMFDRKRGTVVGRVLPMREAFSPNITVFMLKSELAVDFLEKHARFDDALWRILSDNKSDCNSLQAVNEVVVSHTPHPPRRPPVVGTFYIVHLLMV